MRVLIVDGYPQAGREELESVGCTPAFRMYARMLRRRAPEAAHDFLFPADDGTEIPSEEDLAGYDGVLWTGCNLTIYHDHDERVARQVELSRRAYRAGTPQFGSCWGIQMAAVAAGGRVQANPRGREVGIARKIHVTANGHPMFEGKPPVFDAIISHLDEVTGVPEGAQVLAGNGFTGIQALVVRHARGVFWGVQYHPEFELWEIARLMVARQRYLIAEGFFASEDEVRGHVEALEQLSREPERRDLRWRLGIGGDILSEDLREREFVNWLAHCVRASEVER